MLSKAKGTKPLLTAAATMIATVVGALWFGKSRRARAADEMPVVRPRMARRQGTVWRP